LVHGGGGGVGRRSAGDTSVGNTPVGNDVPHARRWRRWSPTHGSADADR
jgi:hypothetical protein